MTSRDIANGTTGKGPENRDWNAIEPGRTAMRLLVADIELELGKLGDAEPLARAEALARLTTTWRKLVAELALGSEPSLRACPFCHLSIRYEATRCRYCLKGSPAGRAAHSAPTTAQRSR